MIDVKIFVDAKKFTKYFNIPKHIFFWRSQVTRKNNLPPKKESPQKKIHPPKKYPPPKKKSTPFFSKKSAYLYLPESVDFFLKRDDLSKKMEIAGFKNIRYVDYTFGVATLYIGDKIE